VSGRYPEHLLHREPAPPYEGEGAFALWHFSEDPGLHRFEPRVPAANPVQPPLVWAVDTRHAPTFWFPRDCPRGCIWPVSTTTPEDRERFFGQSGTGRVHVIEADWLDRVRTCRLYAYRLPKGSFRPHQTGGYWVCDTPVEATERILVDDLIGRHARARIELRITRGLADNRELDQVDRAVREHLDDPRSVIMSGMLFLVWARKPECARPPS
jgi:hypothetical protein